ncbi:DNA-directed RNA polymerase subunit M/transcription elongation factor TFIIS [Rhizobium leguminosarum]|uniref:hypothetical protein n=1 Tax=Rhizobium leguminosarum TaxID=384 RepID=UPI00160C5C56|nr:hypothetical protein [Rhizobium leguminosarum]MBB5664743.1 DNA-directed RNA polymerase subunit M/transcription elongation factor TFIIS [Rhizobium leguminosarum]
MSKKTRAPMSEIVIGCADCGETISTKSRKRLYCDSCKCRRKEVTNAEYRSKNRKPTRNYTCERCGVVAACNGGATHKYCDDCSVEVRRERERAYDSVRRQPVIIGFTVSCDRCGDGFERKHAKQIVCKPCSKTVSAERSRKWADDNRDKVRASAKRYNDIKRSTPQGHLEWTMRTAVRRAIGGSEKAGKRTFEILGYSIDELKTHLERKFVDGMSWDNYGEWHIDHERPLASFQYETPECEQFKMAWCLDNLQPLWGSDNMSKGAKYQMAA